MTKACCPGSFDPVTNGHIDIVERTAGMFAEVVVAVGDNPAKQTLFSLEERLEMLREVTAHLDGVKIASFRGLLVDFCKQEGARVIVKGLRAVTDFDFEMQMAQMNARMGVNTVFMATNPEYSYLSSSLLKEVLSLGGQIDGLVPPTVLERLRTRFPEQGGFVMDHMEALEALEDVVRGAKNVPLSASIVVPKQEVLSLLATLRDTLPREHEEAREIVGEREEVLAEARDEAAAIVERAQADRARLISRTELVQAADAEAARLVSDAEAEAAKLKHQADDYVDAKLANFEIILNKALRTVSRGREQLQERLAAAQDQLAPLSLEDSGEISGSILSPDEVPGA